MKVPPPLDAAPPPDEPMPFRKVPGLLSKGERAFWHPLAAAVRGKYRLFCKVRLADLVCCPPDHPSESERYWFKKIGRFHVDFVLVDPSTTEPLLVIELDDGSHRSRKQQRNDALKDAALAAAKLPIYRVRAQQAYDVVELGDEIAERVGRATR